MIPHNGGASTKREDNVMYSGVQPKTKTIGPPVSWATAGKPQFSYYYVNTQL